MSSPLSNYSYPSTPPASPSSIRNTPWAPSRTPTRTSARLAIKNTRFPSFPRLDEPVTLFAPKIKDRAGPRRFNSAEAFYYCTELMGLAQTATEIILKHILCPFILLHQFYDFLEKMNDTGAGIMGSVARRMLATNSMMMQHAIKVKDFRYLRSNDLNIVVPKGSLDAMVEWFTAHSYDAWDTEVVSKPYVGSVRRMVSATRQPQNGVPRARITISESLGNVMQVILASNMTCQTNLVTSTRVYAVYPTLVTDQHALKTDITSLISPRRPRPPYLLRTSNFRWTGPCGFHCPSLPRKTVGDKGIASFLWNTRYPIPESRYSDTDSLLAQSILQWRFAKRCGNPKCKRFMPPRSLVM
ncbi:hypothetical protein D9611_009022 [Ephemerocybe angulata]|uniref:Uncharacterized protein n=1 Tax=Ephemerocybe angulata TaxID=980116 RepID=A0A8H5FD13_9AGAR|nr:hypothetical protein D9611_009022 [Tulosesus angulatus]